MYKTYRLLYLASLDLVAHALEGLVDQLRARRRRGDARQGAQGPALARVAQRVVPAAAALPPGGGLRVEGVLAARGREGALHHLGLRVHEHGPRPRRPARAVAGEDVRRAGALLRERGPERLCQLAARLADVEEHGRHAPASPRPPPPPVRRGLRCSSAAAPQHTTLPEPSVPRREGRQGKAARPAARPPGRHCAGARRMRHLDLRQGRLFRAGRLSQQGQRTPKEAHACARQPLIEISLSLQRASLTLPVQKILSRENAAKRFCENIAFSCCSWPHFCCGSQHLSLHTWSAHTRITTF